MRKKEDRERWLSNDLKFDDEFAKEEKKQNMDMISFNPANVPKGYTGSDKWGIGRWCLLGTWRMIGSRDFSSEIATTEAFRETAVVADAERVVLSRCHWAHVNRDVAKEVGGVGVGLGKFSVEPDRIVSGQLGQRAGDCITDDGGEIMVDASCL